MTHPAYDDVIPGAGTERSRLALDMYAAAHAENEARRARVLRHADLREVLVELGYTRASNWNGYIPPKTIPTGNGGGWSLNQSAARAALIAVSAEALHREQAEGDR